MIVCRYYPCVFEDRFYEIETHNITPVTILASLMKKFPEIKDDPAGVVFRVNGRKLSIFEWKTPLKNGDRALIIQEMGFGIGEFIVAAIAYGGVTAAIGIYGAIAATLINLIPIIASIAYTIYSYCTAPTAPKVGTGVGLNNSPTYGWDGVQMQVRQGIPVPIIYGTHLTGGNLIEAYITTENDKNYLNMLIALAEGQIEGIMKEDLSSVCTDRFNDRPYILVNDNFLSNFSGCEYEWRVGTESQSVMSGFGNICQTYSTSSAEMTTTPYIYTTVDDDVQDFELRFRAPSIYAQYKGNFYPTTITVHIEHKLHTDTVWTDDGSLNIIAASTEAIRRTYKSEGLAAGQYDIRMTLTAGGTTGTVQSQIFLDNVIEIKYDNLTYPHTALLALKLQATEQLSSTIPNVLVMVRGRQILNLETGLIGWSQNPVYCMYDLMTNSRYGIGRYVSSANINADQLIEMARYCDEMVGDGVRYQGDSANATSLTDYDYTFQASDIGKTLCVQCPTDATVYTNLIITSIGVELITNGGMETGNPPTGWVAINTPETFERSETQKHGGSYSLYINDSTPSYGGALYTFAASARQAGKSYLFSFWYYIVSGTMAAAIYDGDGTTEIGTGIYNTTGSWQYAEIPFYESITDGGLAFLYFINLSNTVAGEFYIDDVSVKETIATHTALGADGWSNGTPATVFVWEYGEKRNQLDIVIDSQGAAFDTINQICGSFRGVPIWAQNNIQLLIEKKEDPSYLFNMGNTLEGSFKHTYASEKDKANCISVDYADQTKKFQKETVEVTDFQTITGGTPKRTQRMSLIGASRQSQVYREGRYHLYAAKYQDEQISFKAAIDAIHVLPGDVIYFQHDIFQWGWGGRIVSATASSVTLDQTITMRTGKTYSIVCRLDGDALETRTITDGPGDYSTVNVSPNFSSIPAAYSLYAFGESGIEAKPFRIMAINKTPENEVEVSAVEYSDNTYSDTNVILAEPIYSALQADNQFPSQSEVTGASSPAQVYAERPVIYDCTWYDNEPTSLSIGWSAHTLYYYAMTYPISSGNSTSKYVHWDYGSTSYSLTNDMPILSHDDFLMATNINGTHDLAWNAPANQGTGTSHIQNFAITRGSEFYSSSGISVSSTSEIEIGTISITETSTQDSVWIWSSMVLSVLPYDATGKGDYAGVGVKIRRTSSTGMVISSMEADPAVAGAVPDYIPWILIGTDSALGTTGVVDYKLMAYCSASCTGIGDTYGSLAYRYLMGFAKSR